MLYELRRRSYGDERNPDDPKFLVFFEVEKVLPLIGPGEDTPEGPEKGDI